VNLTQELLFFHGNTFLLDFEQLDTLSVVSRMIHMLLFPSLKLCRLELEGFINRKKLPQITI
jgi:hypothetical protein